MQMMSHTTESTGLFGENNLEIVSVWAIHGGKKSYLMGYWYVGEEGDYIDEDIVATIKSNQNANA